MRAKFILDGYNVVGKIPELTRILDTKGLERSREALCAMLADIMYERKACEFVVVFDGCSGDIAHDAVTRIRGIECRFTRSGEEADDYIGDMLSRMKDRRGVAVISEDGKVANKCKVHGVQIFHPSSLTAKRGNKAVRPAESGKELPQREADDITNWYKKNLDI